MKRSSVFPRREAPKRNSTLHPVKNCFNFRAQTKKIINNTEFTYLFLIYIIYHQDVLHYLELKLLFVHIRDFQLLIRVLSYSLPLPRNTNTYFVIQYQFFVLFFNYL